MKRLIYSSIVTALILSLAAPAGAVFASSGVDPGTPPPVMFGEVDAKEVVSAVGETGEAIDSFIELSELDGTVETEEVEAGDGLTEDGARGSGTTQHDSLGQIQATPPSSFAITEGTPPKAQGDEVGVPSEESTEPGAVTPPEDKQDDDQIPTSDVLVTVVQLMDGSLRRIELTNTTTSPVSVQGWSVVETRLVAGQEVECEIGLEGYILGGRTVSYLVASDPLEPEGVYRFAPCNGGDNETVSRTRITVEKAGVVFERLKLPEASNTLYERGNTTKTYMTGTFEQDFKAWNKAQEYPFTTAMLYVPPPTTPLKIVELLPNPLPCMPGEQAQPACTDYVKLYNPTKEPIDLSQYRLRTGKTSTASSASNTYQLFGQVEAESYVLLQAGVDGSGLALTNGDGSAWLQDQYGAIDYPSGVVPYERADTAANTGRSWAYNQATGAWQWATPAPHMLANDFTPPTIAGPAPGGADASDTELKPCRADQFRNPETNRCKLIASTSSLTPCREGQYRSSETNRCRSIATTAAASLQPCDADQFRNPETNRCKKIATATALADCGPGRERNPQTNRCRNILTNTPPEAGFAVEPIVEPASTFIGWAVLGAVGLLAVGYAGYEWRQEIGRLVRRVIPTSHSGK